MKKWLWIGIGISCLAFFEFGVFANSDAPNGWRWLLYALIGLGVLAKAFPRPN